jgi:hypothetical protein
MRQRAGSTQRTHRRVLTVAPAVTGFGPPALGAAQSKPLSRRCRRGFGSLVGIPIEVPSPTSPRHQCAHPITTNKTDEDRGGEEQHELFNHGTLQLRGRAPANRAAHALVSRSDHTFGFLPEGLISRKQCDGSRQQTVHRGTAFATQADQYPAVTGLPESR